MSVEQSVSELAQKVRELKPIIETEEATKTAFIIPFISNVLGYDCQMRVFGTGVPETRYCRVPGSWYRGRADGVGPVVCFIRPVLLGWWPCACRSLRCGFGGRC